MFNSASLFVGLDRAVLAHQRQNIEDDGSICGTSKKKYNSNSKREMQAKEIYGLLKKRYYYVFRYDNDTGAQQFMETDNCQLLERSSRTVTYVSSGQ